jgi:CheY-specific phosphatase CheX
MMKNNDRKILTEVCYRVFEQLAFMFGEELEDDDIDCDAERFLRATMGFNGPHKGLVELIVPDTITGLMAANILGLDEDHPVDDDNAVDALKELLNTITGQLMTSLYGEDAVMDLTIPETAELDHEGWQALVETDQYLAIIIEDNPVLISIQS